MNLKIGGSSWPYNTRQTVSLREKLPKGLRGDWKELMHDVPQNAIPLNAIPGHDQVAHILAGRRLLDFPSVCSFTYAEEDDALGERWMNVRLVLTGDERVEYAKIGLLFERVSDVQFSGFGSIMGLYFQTVAETSRERLRFGVGDYEDQKIHLYCHSISFFPIEQIR